MLKPVLAKMCLKLIKKKFSKHRHLYKMFNLNTAKLTYSSMSNILGVIKQSVLAKAKSYHTTKEIKKILKKLHCL